MNVSKSGPTVSVTAHGDTREELEADAIKQAREYFGEEAKLAINGTYGVMKSQDPGIWGKFFANVSVMLAESEPADKTDDKLLEAARRVVREWNADDLSADAVSLLYKAFMERETDQVFKKEES